MRRIVLFSLILIVTLSSCLFPQNTGDVLVYTRTVADSPIYDPDFIVGPSDKGNPIYIGSQDPNGPPMILSGTGKSGLLAFDCGLRFYGQKDLNNATGADCYPWDFYILPPKVSCNDKTNCPLRNGSQPYAPGNTACGGKNHYVRWAGIFDGSYDNSLNLIPIDKKKPVWKEIEFKIVMSVPNSGEMPLVPEDSKWVPFSDDIVKIIPHGLLPAKDTVDFSAWVSLNSFRITFPISFQNCTPGKDDTHMIDQTNSYTVKLMLKFPYAEWADSVDLTNKTKGLKVEDDTSSGRWNLTISERQFFVWDKVPPKIELTCPGPNTVMNATTGDPMYNNNIIKFRVTDDNPNQEIDTVTVTLGNGSTFNRQYQYIDGDDANNTIKKPKISRKTDLSAGGRDTNFVAEFEVVLTPPPNGMKREDILKTDQYFIAPHNSVDPIIGRVTASVKYGEVDPVTQHNACTPSPNDPPAEFAITVKDNDPPGLEVGFILMKTPSTEVMEFVKDFSVFPASKKACGIKVGAEIDQAEYCLDLNSYGTPIDIHIYPFGKGTPVDSRTLVTYSKGRQAGDLPAEVIIDKNDIPTNSGLLVIEDERYYYVIKTIDNIPGDVTVCLKHEVGCLTLNQKTDTPITIRDSTDWLLHRILFTTPEEETYIVLNATDQSGNALFAKIPFKILNSVLNWTSIDDSSK